MGPGQYGVHKTDSTWSLIKADAAVFNGLFDSGKRLCSGSGSPSK